MTSDVSLSRRDWLSACSLLALAASGCGLGSRLTFAQRVLSEPHPDYWRPVLGALIQALVAFEDPEFPKSVSRARVEEQLLSMFPLEDPAQFSSLRRGLVAFDETELFASRQAMLVDDERGQGTADAVIEAAVTHDARALAQAQLGGRFVELDLGGRRTYLELWACSPFRQRRQFYRGAKTLTMIATYSLEPVWQAIGYDGPVLAG